MYGWVGMCRQKGLIFWNGGVCHCKTSGKGFKYTCLERGSCLSGKGVVNYISLEWGYHKWIVLMIRSTRGQ